MSRFLSEFLATAAFLGIGARLCTGVPAPLFVILPLFLFVPFIVRDFAEMTPEFVSAVSDSLTAVAAIVGAGLAWVGVSAWRQQLIGENEYQLSVRLQELLFDIQGIVQSLRRDYSMEDANFEWRKKLNEVGEEFDSQFRKGRAHWGDKIKELKPPITKLLGELRHNMSVNDAMRSEHPPHEYYKDNFDEIIGVIHGNAEETDRFSVSWNKAISDLEMFLKQFIKK